MILGGRGSDVELLGYLAMIRARWRVVAAVTLLGILTAVAASATATPLYQSRAEVFFSVGIDPTPGSLSRGLDYSAGLVQSYKDIATTPYILDPVIGKLGLRTTSSRLAREVAVRIPNNTFLLEVTATDSSPQRAAAIASGVAEQLTVAAREITPKLGTQPTSVQGTTVSPATVPKKASFPYTRLNLVVALLLGLLVGAVVALALEVWDPKLRNRPQVGQLTDVPVLGTVGVRGRRFDRLRRFLGRVPGLRQLLGRVAGPAPQEELAVELGANFEHLRESESLRLVTVTSAGDEAVTTRAVIDIAAFLAKRGVGVLVVDGDLRHPSLGKGPGGKAATGLSSVLTAGQHWTDSVQHFVRMPLSVMPSGPPVPDPGAELSSPRAAEVLSQLTERYGFVLLKAPPVLRAAEGLVLSSIADGTIVVTERRAMRKKSLAETLDVLDVAGVRVAGVVVGAR